MAVWCRFDHSLPVPFAELETTPPLPDVTARTPKLSVSHKLPYRSRFAAVGGESRTGAERCLVACEKHDQLGNVFGPAHPLERHSRHQAGFPFGNPGATTLTRAPNSAASRAADRVYGELLISPESAIRRTLDREWGLATWQGEREGDLPRWNITQISTPTWRANTKASLIFPVPSGRNTNCISG